jgi:hypothetical protein
MLPRAEEVDLGRAAKAHCIQSSGGSRASNHLQGQPDRHAANRRISRLNQSLMLISSSVRRAMLAVAIEEARRISTQAGYLSLDQTDASIIARVPIFNAVGGEIPEDGNE